MNHIFFRAVIVDERSYEDTESTRVILRLTHADLSGAMDPSSDLRKCKLADAPLVSFRLEGLNALDKFAEYYGRLPHWQHINTGPGGVCYFTAASIREGGGQWFGEPVHLLNSFAPESLSLKPEAKRVKLVFEQPAEREEVQPIALDQIMLLESSLEPSSDLNEIEVGATPGEVFV